VSAVEPSAEDREAVLRAFDAARAEPRPPDRGTTGSLLITIALAVIIGVAVTAGLLGFSVPGGVAAAVYGVPAAFFAAGLWMVMTRTPPERVARERAEAALGDLAALDPASDPRRTLETAARVLAFVLPAGEGPRLPALDPAETADRAGDALPWLETAERVLIAAGRAEPTFTTAAVGDTIFEAPPGEAGDTVFGLPPLSDDDRT
jgi:hypothetical protein